MLTYAVADLVVPLPGPKSASGALADKKFENEFLALERHLRRLTGTDAWTENCSIQRYEPTLSLVIRQSAAVHERIADELSRLRRELDVQVELVMHVITGPREQIAALANDFPGDLGQFESEQLLKRAKELPGLVPAMSPKITLFSRQTAQLYVNGRAIAANATVSDNRRSIGLKISEGPEGEHDVLGNLQVVQVHSGRSVALRFEAPKVGGNIPAAPDADERLVIVTPRVLIVEQVETPPKVVITVEPRIIFHEEEEEMLGIPR